MGNEILGDDGWAMRYWGMMDDRWANEKLRDDNLCFSRLINMKKEVKMRFSRLRVLEMYDPEFYLSQMR